MPMNFDDNHWFDCCDETNCCEPEAEGALAVLAVLGVLGVLELGLLAWPVVAELGDDEVELAADGLLSIDELLFIDEPPELPL